MAKTAPAIVVVLSVALALGSGGCSWLFVQPLPPSYEPGDPVSCTSNVAAPVIDSIFTVLDTLELVTVGGNDNVQNKNAVILGATLGIIVWGASAIYGYRHTTECSEAQSDAVRSYRPYRHVRAPAPGYQPPPPRPRLAPPGPPAPPAPPPEEAAPPVEPSVEVPAAPPAPQQQDNE
ncbi:MAG TPA: hypothetical protein VKZ18_29655 [Polyangia bacterium]|nr:hypothetical protein [Polyangia bacterium]